MKSNIKVIEKVIDSLSEYEFKRKVNYLYEVEFIAENERDRLISMYESKDEENKKLSLTLLSGFLNNHKK